MKKEKEIKFSPTDYDYLDKASLEDWVSEILARNKEFASDCKKICLGSKDYRIGLSEYKVWVPTHEKVVRYTKSGKLKLMLMSEPVRVYRLLGEENKDSDIESRRLYEKMHTIFKNLVTPEAWDWWYMCNHDFKLHRDDNLEDIVETWLGQPDDDGCYITGDTLLLAIDMNHSKKDILTFIEKIMKIHKPKKRDRRRLDKWKYYLIVFDLREQGLSYKEIADQLVSAYPNDKNLFDERNIENYYGSALKLINGEYKLYY